MRLILPIDSSMRSAHNVRGPVAVFHSRPSAAQLWQDVGFTLIELLVVLAIIALLLTLATPRYWNSISRAQESVLRENLYLLREAVDRHYADRARYPDSLEQLVERRYLRAIPPDPLTESATTWIFVPPTDTAAGAIFDVKSGAAGIGRNAVPYAEW
jgi:general secretion pathway protein G